jgi:signal transduction histidine kinase
VSDSAGESLSSAAAHELKNPLGAAKGALELILEPAVLENAEDRERMTRMALRNVEKAIELVNDLRGPSPANDSAGDGGAA